MGTLKNKNIDLQLNIEMMVVLIAKQFVIFSAITWTLLRITPEF